MFLSNSDTHVTVIVLGLCMVKARYTLPIDECLIWLNCLRNYCPSSEKEIEVEQQFMIFSG